ncbi:gluconate:H+ symporter [Flavihumibacter fluvii]|uniref:GntT/GntP/DsdX family permease n=1 Tax=Flavihumibacter fluvii TaxID=2838157 RepID=UPI001BDE0319|nr:gluconate:H+ symporter [Flavihumibacter fluvii]ULQ53548.1 gluconate:H+ symporter [Flavihumibacter fluvii]
MSILILVAAILLLLFLTLNKVSPFIALLLVTIGVGLAYGLSFPVVMKSIQNGIGDLLGSMALILCLGAMQGRLLEKSGVATVISRYLMEKFGQRYLQWAVLLMGFLVGIPLFYNAGFVILVPFVFTIAASAGVPLLYVAMPMAASLSVTHGFLPPHPGPIGLAAIFKASVGKTMLYGLIVAVPVVWMAGILFGKRFRRSTVMAQSSLSPELEQNLPSASLSIFIALLPVLLIAIPAACLGLFKDSPFATGFLSAIGDPVMALILTTATSGYFLAIRRGMSVSDLMGHYTKAIESVAMILMVIAAGGAFKEVLTVSGVAKEVAGIISGNAFPPLIAGWLVAAGIRVMIGSATIAGLTTAGIIAPLVQSSGIMPELMVLSVGAGSLFCSHVNDTGFWMFKEYFGITVKQTLMSWTIMETIVSIAGLVMVLLLSTLV